MTTKLDIDLAHILQHKHRHGFHVPVHVGIDEILEFGDDDWNHELDLDDFLESEGQVAIIWDVRDVLERRPDLDETQAWEVLKLASSDFQHDGCHLDFIASTAEGLYPKECVVATLTDEAISAFWGIVSKRFPHATHGDLSPGQTTSLREAAGSAIKEWIANNVPTADSKGA